MRLWRDPEEIVHLKFCKENENTFTEVLRVNRSIMLVELLAEDVYNLRVMKDNYVLFVNLLRMTEALAGLYGCFIGREKALVGDSSLRVVFKNGSLRLTLKKMDLIHSPISHMKLLQEMKQTMRRKN